MRIRIGIVDDKPQNRMLLSEQLGIAGNFDIVLTARNGIEFLEKMKMLETAQYPQVVLMDIEMPEMNGIEAVSNGSAMYPGVNFLMLTVFDDDDKIFEAIRAGATGYLLKDEKISVITDYIQQIVEVGGVPMSPSIARKAMKMLMNSKSVQVNPGHDEHELSERELEVLNLLVNGYDYKMIAQKLFLSAHTVRKHIANIYSKLHINSKAQAINLVHHKKWFS